MLLHQYNLFLVLAQASALISLLIGVYSWSQRYNKGASTFAIFMGLVCCWVLSDTFELVAVSQQATLFWGRLSYVFIGAVPVSWFIFIIQFFGNDRWINPGSILLLLVIPVITNIFMWVTPYDTLIWSGFEVATIGNYTTLVITGYGAWFWINAAYSYLMIGYGTFLLVRHVLFSSTAYRRQSYWLLIGAVIPIGFNLIYVFRIIPGLQKDFTTIAFTFSGLALAIGIARFQLFSLSPLTRDFIIDQIQDGYIITDNLKRIIDINPAAEEIFDLGNNDIVGQPVTQLLPDLANYEPRVDYEPIQLTISFDQDSGIKHYDVKVTRIKHRGRWAKGTIILLRDITERVNLLKKVEQLAITDDLTQVFNRRHFYYLANNALKLAARYQRPLSIIMLDIDHFKAINDQYGHGVGDIVLKYFVKNALKTLRESDTFARLGGEEFIILLPETTPDEGVIVAERLRSVISNAPIKTEFGEIPITISLGVASTASISASISLQKLVDRADRALYKAKNSGRNQVIAYDPELPPVHPPRTVE